MTGGLTAGLTRAQLGLPRYQVVCTKYEADLEGVVPEDADCCLIKAYGDNVQIKYGCHMDGGITNDEL